MNTEDFKHPNAEIIKAKADDVRLVMFSRDRYDSSSEWGESYQWGTDPDFDYFLCLPQHAVVCVHWLNGGEVQTRRECSDLGWDTLLPFEGEWSKVSHFMCNDILLRIKPKIKKVWVAVLPWAGNADFVVPKYFDTRDNLDAHIRKTYMADAYQVIEIEVEV